MFRFHYYCVPIIFLLSFGHSGAAPNERLTLSDIFEFESVSDPRISPDGQQVVYVRSFADIMTDRRYSNLWICDFDGSAHRALTTGKQSDSSPRWSPDGSRLIYTSSQGDESPQIYLRWMDSGQTARLTNLQTPPAGLAFSPDGTQISFTTLVPEQSPGAAIAKLPSPPEGAQWAAPAQVYDKLNYRFNGEGYHPYGYTHIFVLPSEGGTPRRISHGNFHHGRRTGAPVWTPDGRHLIVSANRRADSEMEPLDNEIWEFPVSSGEAKALTSRRGPDDDPVVSPDGASIAYLGFDDRYQGYQLTRLYVMNRDGTQPRVLAQDLDRSLRQPQWAPDGSGVYALYDDQRITKLGFFGLDGSRKDVAENVGPATTAYSGGSFTVANNGRVAFTLNRPDIPSDVAVVAPGAEVRRITAVNDDLLAQRRIGSLEEFWYESSKDGRKIQGWVIKPPDFDPSAKWPLILEIHGGPFANYGARFDLEKQLMAAAGYVVLYTNPRGSTGYGEEFGNLIHHAYPGDDFYDLDSGVDAVVAKGYIDADDLFVTGGSGGGVLTAWMIGRTNRFRAAVSVYPVINWYSWLLTSDISAFGLKYWFPGFPWDHPEHYEKRSLLSVVKNVQTPTMVLTGEADYRTPMSESEQYFQALKLLGVDTVLVRVPDEPHGIRVRPSHHIQKIGYIQGWFDSHRNRPALPASGAQSR